MTMTKSPVVFVLIFLIPLILFSTVVIGTASVAAQQAKQYTNPNYGGIKMNYPSGWTQINGSDPNDAVVIWPTNPVTSFHGYNEDLPNNDIQTTFAVYTIEQFENADPPIQKPLTPKIIIDWLKVNSHRAATVNEEREVQGVTPRQNFTAHAIIFNYVHNILESDIFYCNTNTNQFGPGCLEYNQGNFATIKDNFVYVLTYKVNAKYGGFDTNQFDLMIGSFCITKYPCPDITPPVITPPVITPPVINKTIPPPPPTNSITLTTSPPPAYHQWINQKYNPESFSVYRVDIGCADTKSIMCPPGEIKNIIVFAGPGCNSDVTKCSLGYAHKLELNPAQVPKLIPQNKAVWTVC